MRRLALAVVLGSVACSSPPGGTDAGRDAGVDGGLGGSDAGSQIDAGSDAGVDAGTDAGTPRDGGWAVLAPLPTARQETAVAALGGHLYVVGGIDTSFNAMDSVIRYDPASDAWSNAPSLPFPAHHCNLAAVGGRLWVVGALRDPNFTATNATWSWAPGETAWTSHTGLPLATARGASGVAVLGTRIYLLGGFRGGAVAESSSYDTATDTHAILPALPAPRDHLVAGTWGSVVFAIAGRASALDGRVDAFDTDGGTWSSRAPMPTPRAAMAAGQLGSAIITAGGEGNANDPMRIFKEVELYDAQTDTWRVLPPMRTPRHGTGGAVIGDVFYVPGGATREGFGAVITFESMPFP